MTEAPVTREQIDLLVNTAENRCLTPAEVARLRIGIGGLNVLADEHPCCSPEDFQGDV